MSKHTLSRQVYIQKNGGGRKGVGEGPWRADAGLLRNVRKKRQGGLLKRLFWGDGKKGAGLDRKNDQVFTDAGDLLQTLLEDNKPVRKNQKLGKDGKSEKNGIDNEEGCGYDTKESPEKRGKGTSRYGLQKKPV